MTQNSQKHPGFWRVLSAMLYDGIVVLSFLLIASALWLPLGFGSPWYRAYKAFLLLSILFYFAWCWTRGGQTAGMKVWRFRLVRSDGGRVRWPQSVTRFVGALFSFLAFGGGYWWMLLNRQRKSWHDVLSGTRLVMEPQKTKAH